MFKTLRGLLSNGNDYHRMYVSNLSDVTQAHASEVGRKAAALGELLRAGHRVPAGFVVTTKAEQRLTPAVSKAVLQHFDSLKFERAAVRSSGASEDGKDQSWAGQFATFLHVERSGVLEAIRSCWVSADAARVAAYANGARIGGMAVLVQQMVHSQTAGVAFSVNPVTGNQSQIMVEAVYGLGELLVQGLSTPDNYLLDKATGQALQSDIAEKLTLLTYQNGHTIEIGVPDAQQKSSALSSAQLRELAQLVRDIEDYYGFPVDIEWAYEDDLLYLLQARPITTV